MYILYIICILFIMYIVEVDLLQLMNFVLFCCYAMKYKESAAVATAALRLNGDLSKILWLPC